MRALIGVFTLEYINKAVASSLVTFETYVTIAWWNFFRVYIATSRHREALAKSQSFHRNPQLRYGGFAERFRVLSTPSC